MRFAFSGGAATTLAFAVNVAYTVLMAALIVRVITSWFGLTEHDRRLRPVLLLTNWLVEPIRRRVPPFGMFDISPLVAWLVLMLGRAVLLAIIL
jgi:YggT family protein